MCPIRHAQCKNEPGYFEAFQIDLKRRQQAKKSKGLGDTIKKITDATGITRVVHAVAGEDCGCDERQDLLNQLVPYKPREAVHPIPKHVTKFAIGVTTAPRKEPTLRQSVKSIVKAGFTPTVYAEPGTDLTGVDVPIVRRDELHGCWGNWKQTLEDLLQSQPDAQAIGIFQDDIVMMKGVRDYLEHDLWPSDNTGVVSLYSPAYRVYESADRSGLARITDKYLVGACAMIFPRQVAEQITKLRGFRNWRGAARGTQKDPAKKKAIDTFIGHAIVGMGKHIYYYTPSMCSHIAKHSSVGHGGNSGKRNSRLFPGEDINASTIYPPPWVRYNLPSGNQRFSEPAIPSSEPVNVIIPAKDCEELTVKCLEHLAFYAEIPIHVIYVDDGSKEGVAGRIEATAKKYGLSVEVIRNVKPVGFADACNQGFKRSAGRHVLLLNNDCFIGPGCLTNLKRHLEQHPRVGAVGPVTGDDGHQSLKHGSRRKKAGLKEQLIDRYDPIEGAEKCQRNHVTTESMLAFFCTMIHRDAVADVGYQDPHPDYAYGLGADDDWCRRAIRRGWRLLLCYDAFAAHLHKASFRRLGIDRAAAQKRAYRRLVGTR